MQSIFRLAWCSDQPSDKEVDKMRQTPLVDISLFNKLKRKRTDSPEAVVLPGADDRDAKRTKSAARDRDTAGRRPSDAPVGMGNEAEIAHDLPQLHVLPHGLAQPSRSDMHSTAPTAAATSDELTSKLRDTIEHQFNLEILIKHRELRLIDQELAKCQTALEQLRRCELVPYPGATGLSEHVSSGSGPALRPLLGFTQPQAPAPWGTTDGPYTRHYSKWLVQDPSFDSSPVTQTPLRDDSFSGPLETRSTRNGGAGMTKSSRSRSMRESVSSIQALPNYPVSASRSKQGPLVLKRLADNQFVKLVCNNCQRSDFSSVQGFLNHCRIAHKIDYKSHEAAAQDCGRLLEDHETGLATQAAAPPAAIARTPAPKVSAAQAPVLALSTTRVHPFISNGLPQITWKRQRLANSQAAQSLYKTAVPQASTPAAASYHATPLVPSTSTPYLSAAFAKRGLGGNLERAVTQAKEKVNIESEDGDEEDGAETPVSKKRGSAAPDGLRTVSGAMPLDSERPMSRKGYRQPTQRPRPAPLTANNARSEIPESPQDADLSPHTADSNPGLVSDHDDDPVSEPDDDATSVTAPAHPIGLGRATCGDSMVVDMEVDDDNDGHGLLIRPRSMLGQGDLRDAGSPSRQTSRKS